MSEGLQAVETILSFHPLSFELLDHHIIQTGKLSSIMKGRLDWLSGNPEAIFIVEFDSPSPEETQAKLLSFAQAMQELKIGQLHQIVTDPKQMTHVWDLRKSGLGLLLSKKSYSRAIAFLEDISVAPHLLAPFMERFRAYLKEHGKEAGIYGHVGAGCMHIRPYMDLRDSQEQELMQQMMLDVSNLLLEYGGTLSGEHGDGLIRSWLNKKMFGESLYQAFCELKQAFDPLHLMNPGKIVDGPPLLENLKSAPLISQPFPTFLDFTKEGGIELAADLCNGNGQCRKSETLMCPSFQVTQDEYQTTRARAQALRAIFNDRVPLENFTDPETYAVLDLCIECKGCQSECPSSVDMAKMKSEFLYQFQEKHGYSLRNRLFASVGLIQKFLSPFASLVNALDRTFLSNWMKKWIGITPNRPLPLLAKERFSHWFQEHVTLKGDRKQVVLFNDTYTEFNQPEIGKAAVQVLIALGYDIILPPWKCCGRPAISKGFLKQAQQMAFEVVEELAEYAEKGLPIIGLEPSCILTLKDDFRGLLGKSKACNSKHLEAVMNASVTFDEFVHQHLREGKLPIPLEIDVKRVWVHGHCHQKALVGTRPTLEVLKAIPGLEVKEIDSGCCGMAGSFGYEQEHEEISMKIGNLKLFPAIRRSEEDDLIVADGFSCRSQVMHGTERKAYHLAEVLARLI